MKNIFQSYIYNNMKHLKIHAKAVVQPIMPIQPTSFCVQQNNLKLRIKDEVQPNNNNSMTQQ